MSHKLLTWAAAVVLAAAMPGNVYAQGSGGLATVGELTETSGNWLQSRSTFVARMGNAQKICDEKGYILAQTSLLAAIDDQIAQIDAQLRSINASTGEQRVRDQRLSIELLFERERMTKRRAMFRSERYVPCEEPVAEYIPICDAFGSGFFYIPGTDTCLRLTDDGTERRVARIEDPVSYKFFWGGTPAEDSSGLPIAADAAFWDFGASFDPSLTFGGMQTRGAFATETPAPAQLVVPGYNFDTGFQGAGIKAEFSGTVSVGGYPVTLGTGFEFNNATALSSATNVAFQEGFGVPGVGPTSGAFINSPTDMLQFDFHARRQQLGAFFEGTLPLTEDQFVFAGYSAGYRLGVVVGVRGGSFSQAETTTAVTSTPAFGLNAEATSIYETDFTGGFGGLYAGLSLDKNIPFGDDGLSIQEEFSIAAGYDMYRLDIRDHVTANGLGGALNLNDTNSFSYSGGLPNINLDASIGVGTADWTAGISSGLSIGRTALIDYQRLDDGSNPRTNLLSEIGWTIGASFTGHF